VIATIVLSTLIMAERHILGTADKMTQKPAAAAPLYRRLHFPLAMVEARLIRRKTPIPVSPELVSEKEAMLGGLRKVRGHALAFLNETRSRDLSAYGWPHPVSGQTQFLRMVRFCRVAGGTARKQMQETAGNFPKSVTTLQK